MLPGERAHSEKLLDIYKRRLQILETQKVTFGSQVPPYILLDIEDTQKEIKSIEVKLGTKGESQSELRDLDFVNQLEALDTISKYSQANNFVIDAPAGYGKTRLLRELTNRRALDGWHTHMISFEKSYSETNDRSNVIDFIARHFGVNYDPNSQNMIQYISRQVAIKLRKLSSNSLAGENQAGCVLIFDDVERVIDKPNDKSYRDLRAFFDELRNRSARFKNYRLIIVLSGRYISKFSLVLGGSVSVDLKAFDLSVIEQAIDGLLRSKNHPVESEWYRNLAQHVLFVTGGHPKMVKRALTLERIGISHDPIDDFENWIPKNKENIFLDIIDHTIKDIRRDIPKLWNVLKALCVFRRFNRYIIKRLFLKTTRISDGWNTPFELTDELVKSRLVVRSESYFRDGVLRPAIVSWLQFSEPGELKLYCDYAFEILKDELPDPENPSADDLAKPKNFLTIDAIFNELLYIYLIQQHDLVFRANINENDRYNRIEGIRIKMKDHLKTSIRLLSDQEHLADMLEDMTDSLQNDNELTFLFNYIFGSVQTYGDFVHELCDVNVWTKHD